MKVKGLMSATFVVFSGSNQKAEEVREGISDSEREPAATRGPHRPISGRTWRDTSYATFLAFLT